MRGAMQRRPNAGTIFTPGCSSVGAYDPDTWSTP